MNRFVTRTYVILYLLLLSIVFAGGSPQDKKMQITTTSETAREEYKQGMNYFQNFRLPEALKHFEKAVAEDSNFVLALVGVANTQPRFKEMFEIMNQAREMLDHVEVSEGERIYVLGAYAAINSDPETRGASLKKLAKMFPEDEDILFQLGGYHWGRQEFLKSQQVYKDIVSINPSSAPAQNMLGYSHWRLGKYEEAEIAFRENIRLTPNEPNAYDSLAELLLKVGRYEESINVYKKALAIDPLFEISHIGIASGLIHLNRHQEAREWLQQFYEIAPNDGIRSGIHFSLAVVHTDEGNLDAAIKELKLNFGLSEKVNDTFAMATDLNNLSRILFEAGRYEEALAKSNQALKIILDSDHAAKRKEIRKAMHHYIKGAVALRKGSIDLAKSEAAELSSRSKILGNRLLTQTAHQLSGIIALETGDNDAAISELKQTNSGDPYNLFRLAQAYQNQGDTANARKMLKDIIEYRSPLNLHYSFVRHEAAEKLAQQLN